MCAQVHSCGADFWERRRGVYSAKPWTVAGTLQRPRSCVRMPLYTVDPRAVTAFGREGDGSEDESEYSRLVCGLGEKLKRDDDTVRAACALIPRIQTRSACHSPSLSFPNTRVRRVGREKVHARSSGRSSFVPGERGR